MKSNQRRSLLAVLAHPDDESFGAGGMLALHARKGVHVALVCATRGEMGEIADESLATRETLGDVRMLELQKAADALGVTELINLNYRDSGMAGTADNDHPRAFAGIPDDEVVSRLVGVIRRLKPQVVVTFDPNGGYGHPDHITIHRHTVTAFHAASDPDRFPDQGRPWEPSRLFYAVFPRSMFSNMRSRLESLGMDTAEFERFEEIVTPWPDEEVHVPLDVSEVVEAKWKALHAHRTQFGPDNPFRRMPEEIAKEMLVHENFSLAWPETPSCVKLAHLFDGL